MCAYNRFWGQYDGLKNIYQVYNIVKVAKFSSFKIIMKKLPFTISPPPRSECWPAGFFWVSDFLWEKDAQMVEGTLTRAPCRWCTYTFIQPHAILMPQFSRVQKGYDGQLIIIVDVFTFIHKCSCLYVCTCTGILLRTRSRSQYTCRYADTVYFQFTYMYSYFIHRLMRWIL